MWGSIWYVSRVDIDTSSVEASLFTIKTRGHVLWGHLSETALDSPTLVYVEVMGR